MATDDTPGTRCTVAPAPESRHEGWMSARALASDAAAFDPAVAHPARVYAYWLGGKDHYEADRRAAEEVMRLRPQVVAGARANRAFLARAVRFLAADRGIRQFLDIGPGLPVPGSTHEVARQITPACRVVYVDNDPVVLSHARALLTGTPPGSCDYVYADVRDTAAILAGAAATLDLSRPVGVLLLALLHFVPDSDDPPGVVAALAGALAPGSFAAISHLTADLAPEQVGAAARAYNSLAAASVTPRTHSQVSGLFGGLRLLAPGVVPAGEWRTEAGAVSQPCDIYTGVAGIPRRRR
jgi:S-adenosyl methyltransferase